VNYILQGVLTSGTAAGLELANYQAAGKTGTSNVASGDGTPFAAFAGYTTSLVGYVSVFNPVSPTGNTMTGDPSACYQYEYGGESCPVPMFGADAPGSTWHMTFDHADLAGSQAFQPVPDGSGLWSQGDGQTVKQPKKKTGKGGNNGNAGNTGNGNGNNGNGNGNGNNGNPVTIP
jgi:membrane peptidoglycan carboxypeptidase